MKEKEHKSVPSFYSCISVLMVKVGKIKSKKIIEPKTSH